MAVQNRDLANTNRDRKITMGAVVLSVIALPLSVVHVSFSSYWGFDAYFWLPVLFEILFDGDFFNEFAIVLFMLSRMVAPALLIAACLSRGKGRRWLVVGAFAVECCGSFLSLVVGYGYVPASGIFSLIFSLAAFAVVVATPFAKRKLPTFPAVAFGVLLLLSLALVLTGFSPYGYVSFSDGDVELFLDVLIRNPAIWASGALLCSGFETPDKQMGVIARENSGSVLVANAASEIKLYKELLDTGAITQEEFDIKKKELLGL